MGVRPEHLDIVGGEGGALTGVAVHSESLGADSFIYLDFGDEALMTVRLPGTAEVAAGTTLSVAPKAHLNAQAAPLPIFPFFSRRRRRCESVSLRGRN